MKHPLEAKYGLSANELLEALDKRFRAKIALEGAVAEVHMEKQVKALVGTILDKYETHDLDGHPDFSFWPRGSSEPLLAECKNVRDKQEAYRSQGHIVAYKVETQKTRASRSDPTSRYYNADQFDILGVCLGKKTNSWKDFMFVRTAELDHHKNHENKLAVMQRVPLPGSDDLGVWYEDLGELLKQYI